MKGGSRDERIRNIRRNLKNVKKGSENRGLEQTRQRISERLQGRGGKGKEAEGKDIQKWVKI